MLTPRRLIGSLVIGLLIPFAIPATSGASPGTDTKTGESASSNATTRETVRETVTWTLPLPGEDPCPSIPEGVSVSGAGYRVMHTRTRVRDDGTKKVTIEDTVKGPAIDEFGREYRFFYYNLSTQITPPGGRTQVHMIDVFRLRPSHRSHGAAFKVRVDFDWTWTYNPSEGDEIWPPGDDLRKLSTRGDPFLCDPI